MGLAHLIFVLLTFLYYSTGAVVDSGLPEPLRKLAAVATQRQPGHQVKAVFIATVQTTQQTSSAIDTTTTSADGLNRFSGASQQDNFLDSHISFAAISAQPAKEAAGDTPLSNDNGEFTVSGAQPTWHDLDLDQFAPPSTLGNMVVTANAERTEAPVTILETASPAPSQGTNEIDAETAVNGIIVILPVSHSVQESTTLGVAIDNSPLYSLESQTDATDPATSTPYQRLEIISVYPTVALLGDEPDIPPPPFASALSAASVTPPPPFLTLPTNTVRPDYTNYSAWTPLPVDQPATALAPVTSAAYTIYDSAVPPPDTSKVAFSTAPPPPPPPSPLPSTAGEHPISTGNDTHAVDEGNHAPFPLRTVIIVTPILSAVVAATAFGAWWYRRRRTVRRRGDEIQRKAEWLEPDYVANMRARMMGLDPEKVGPQDSIGNGSRDMELQPLSKAAARIGSAGSGSQHSNGKEGCPFDDDGATAEVQECMIGRAITKDTNSVRYATGAKRRGVVFD